MSFEQVSLVPSPTLDTPSILFDKEHFEYVQPEDLNGDNLRGTTTEDEEGVEGEQTLKEVDDDDDDDDDVDDEEEEEEDDDDDEILYRKKWPNNKRDY
ncbi:hypothetical protein LIER_22160 [Lithospermum erythrorhizon]|uniref:Uncharacterized protein n=1 Tax=Lithospermum erythrorhizon TaxID=34254 RepID=A0AAV3QU40_LITER